LSRVNSAGVEHAIKRLNFPPNLLAQGVRLKSGHAIGLLVPRITHSTFAGIIGYFE